MKKTIHFIVCLIVLILVFSISVLASDDEKMVYYSLIENGADGSAVSIVSGDMNVKSMVNNTENGYLTIVPEDNVKGELNTWGTPVTKLRIKLSSAQEVDYSENYDDLSIKVKMKTTVVPRRLWVRTNKNNGAGWSSVISGMAASTETKDNWFEMLVPFKSVLKDDLGNQVTAFKDLYIGFGYDKDLAVQAVDIAEISIVGPDIRKKPTLVTSKMNFDGKYQVELEYESTLPNEVAVPTYYKIGEATCENADVDGNKLTLLFDMMPDFPGELTLDISKDALCSDGYSLYPQIKISNTVTPLVCVKEGYTIDIVEGCLTFNGKIGCIYDKTNSGVDVTALIAVYDQNNAFITYGISETKALSHKMSDDFSVSIEEAKIKEGIVAKLFIIDNVSSGRPLATIE